MIRRRDFLRLGGAVCLGMGGCGIAPGGAEAWTLRQLERADEVARRHGGRGWAAWRGASRVKAWESGYRGPALSITKALAGLAAARALEEGWLDDGETVAAAIPEWRGDARKRRITVRMLLQQTAGLEAGVAALYRNPADKGRNAVELRAVDEPGTVFRYGPACWEVLAELMQRRLSARGGSLEKFLRSAVLRPIGLSSPEWRSDRRGRFYLSTGAELSVEELGRLGRTLAKLLRGENAEGFDAVAFARVTRPSAVNPMFGGGIWRNANARRPGAHAVEVERVIDPPRPATFWRAACLSPRQPPGMAALIGSSGRRVYLWPEEVRVVARLGTAPSWRDGPFLDALG